MSNDAKDLFEKRLHKSLADSARRLAILIGEDPSRWISCAVAREALLILDKIKLLDPEQYGKAVANHGFAELKKRRHYCEVDECFNPLTDPAERCEFSPAIQRYLGSTCASCAEKYRQEDEEEDEQLSDSDKELLAEMEKDLAIYDAKNRTP